MFLPLIINHLPALKDRWKRVYKMKNSISSECPRFNFDTGREYVSTR